MRFLDNRGQPTTACSREHSDGRRQAAAAVNEMIERGKQFFAGLKRAQAEARRHRTAMEEELYGGRRTLSTKNDDDLPTGF